MGWLSGWSKRQAITLTGGADGSQVDYQLKLAIAYDSDMLSDFSDLRFTKEDGETLIDSWLEDKTDGTSADVWVEFPSTPASGAEQTYYMYYRKADAVDYWDIGDTFPFADDFNDNDLSDWSNGVTTDSSDWDTKPSVASGEVYAPSDIKGMQRAGSTISLSTYRQRMRVYVDGNNEYTDIGITNPTTTYSGYQFMVASAVKKTVTKTTSDDAGATTLAVTNDATPTGWHVFELVHKSDGKFGVYYDDTLQGLSTDTADTSVTDFNNTNVRIRYVGDKYDWFFVGKYAANPPTYEFGSEENAPTGLTILDFERGGMRGAFRGIMRGVI